MSTGGNSGRPIQGGSAWWPGSELLGGRFQIRDKVVVQSDSAMASKTPDNFDCVKFQREARRKIYEKTKHLSGEEYDEYWRKYRESDPLWQRLTAIEAERSKQKQVPSDGRGRAAP